VGDTLEKLPARACVGLVVRQFVAPQEHGKGCGEHIEYFVSGVITGDGKWSDHLGRKMVTGDTFEKTKEPCAIHGDAWCNDCRDVAMNGHTPAGGLVCRLALQPNELLTGAEMERADALLARPGQWRVQTGCETVAVPDLLVQCQPCYYVATGVADPALAPSCDRATLVRDDDAEPPAAAGGADPTWRQPRNSRRQNPLTLRNQRALNAEQAQADSAFEWPSSHEQPLHLDLCCHLGQHVLEAAARNRRCNFLGLNLSVEQTAAARAAAQRRRLGNARFLCFNCHDYGSLKELLSDVLQLRAAGAAKEGGGGGGGDGGGGGVVAAVTVLSPDPWFKSSHAQRRLLQPRLLEALLPSLAPGAVVAVCSELPFALDVAFKVLSADARLAGAGEGEGESGAPPCLEGAAGRLLKFTVK